MWAILLLHQMAKHSLGCNATIAVPGDYNRGPHYQAEPSSQCPQLPGKQRSKKSENLKQHPMTECLYKRNENEATAPPGSYQAFHFVSQARETICQW